MTTTFDLARLIHPMPVERFMDEYWEKKPVVIERGQPDYFAELLSWPEIDRVLTTLQLSHPDVMVVDARRDVKAADYTYPSGLVDVARLYQQFADGSSIIVGQLQGQHPAMANLCRAMERDVSHRFQTNIYLTPADEQGLKNHYDSHDVFVLQVEGDKHWDVYGTPIELPFRGQAFDPDQAPEDPGPKTMDFDLKRGDTLYVPRGVLHDPKSVGVDSMHITLGCLYNSWTELLIEAVARVGLHDTDFRRSLPAGFARQDFDRGAAREVFRSLLSRVAEKADFDAALDHFAEDIISTRHSLLEGQLAQVRKLPGLSIDSEAGPRSSLLYKLVDKGAQVALFCYGAETVLPGHCAEPLRHALETPRFRIGDLPGDLDDAGKLVLVTRLVREGILRLF